MARESMRRNRARDPEKYRAIGRRHRGLPEATRPQPECCELCGKPEPSTRGLCLDHDHETGAFRGWLCHCNTSIGGLGDNVAGLRRALDYLERA